MKVLGISCSPRKASNTEALLMEALDGARQEGAIKAARELGRETVQIASLGFEFPKGFRRSHFAYGTHTH